MVLKFILFGSLVGAFVLVPGSDATNADIFDYLETFTNELKKISSLMGHLAEGQFTNTGSCNCHAPQCTCVIMSEIDGNVGHGFRINRVYGTDGDQTEYGGPVDGGTQGNVDSGTTGYQLGSGDQVTIVGGNQVVIKPGYQPRPANSPSQAQEEGVTVTQEKGPKPGVGVSSVNISVRPGENVSNSDIKYQPGLGVAVDGVPQENAGYGNDGYKPGLGNTITIGGGNHEVRKPVHQSGPSNSQILGQRDDITVTQGKGLDQPGVGALSIAVSGVAQGNGGNVNSKYSPELGSPVTIGVGYQGVDKPGYQPGPMTHRVSN